MHILYTVAIGRLHRDRLLQNGRLLQENIKIDFSIPNFKPNLDWYIAPKRQIAPESNMAQKTS